MIKLHKNLTIISLNMEEYIQSYCKHQDLFQATFKKSWLHDRFVLALDLIAQDSSLAQLVEENLMEEIFPGVFSMPAFSLELCNMIVEEAENFLEYAAQHDLAVYRPNSMNKYGLVLNQMGMKELLTDFQQQYL